MSDTLSPTPRADAFVQPYKLMDLKYERQERLKQYIKESFLLLKTLERELIQAKSDLAGVTEKLEKQSEVTTVVGIVGGDKLQFKGECSFHTDESDGFNHIMTERNGEMITLASIPEGQLAYVVHGKAALREGNDE